MRVAFGLQQTSRVELLEVQWPSGTVDRLQDLDANQVLTITEGKGVTARMPFRR
jgi:hypothetical protein